MSFASSTLSTTRSKWRRPTLVASAGLVAAALALGGAVAADAASVATVTSSSATATANGRVTLTADGFQPSEALTVTFDSSPLVTSVDAPYTKDVADGSGHYVATAYLPSPATLGAHTITVTGATTGAATTPITIVAQPTSAVSPSTVALSAYLSKGVTATFSGFASGSTVSFGISTPAMGDQAGPDAAVGASGVATLTYVPTKASGFSDVGTYMLSAFNTAGNIVAQPVTFTVTADPTAPAPAAPVAAPAAPVKRAASFTG